MKYFVSITGEEDLYCKRHAKKYPVKPIDATGMEEKT